MWRDPPADGKGGEREKPSYTQMIKRNENVLDPNLAEKQEEGGDVEVKNMKSPFPKFLPGLTGGGRHKSKTDLGILKTGRSLSCREQSAELTHSTAPVSSGPFTPKVRGGQKRKNLCSSFGMECSGVQVCRSNEHLPPER